MGCAHGRRGRRLAPVGALLAISALSGLAAPAGAETSPTPSAAATVPPPCELHIWPAATTHTTFQGWVRAGAVDGARRGLKGYPNLHADALDTAQQVSLLAHIDWPGAFNDPSLVVVVHPAPTGSADDRARTDRLVAQGSSPCYRELIITSSVVESEVFAARSVRILALRKRFDGAAAPANFASMSEAAIYFTDEDKAAADASARMDAAVRAAFAQAVAKFAVMQSFH